MSGDQRYKLIVNTMIRYYLAHMEEPDRSLLEGVIYNYKQEENYVPTKVERRFLEAIWTDPRYGGIVTATFKCRPKKSRELNFDQEEIND